VAIPELLHQVSQAEANFFEGGTTFFLNIYQNSQIHPLTHLFSNVFVVLSYEINFEIFFIRH